MHRSAELFGSLILWRSFHLNRLHTLLYAFYHQSCWCCYLKFSSMLQGDHVRNIEILSKILFELTLFSHAIKLWTSKCTHIMWKKLGFCSFRFFFSVDTYKSSIRKYFHRYVYLLFLICISFQVQIFIFSTRIYDDNWLKYFWIDKLSNFMKSLCSSHDRLVTSM